MTVVTQAETVPTLLLGSGGSAPQGMELRHLRYFVAVVHDANYLGPWRRVARREPAAVRLR